MEWLINGLISAVSKQNGNQAFAVVVDVPLTPENPPPTSSPSPGTIEVKTFASNEELLRDAREVKIYFRDNNYSGIARITRPILFPASENIDDAKALTQEQCVRTFDAIRWLLLPCVDSWDIRPILRALINAAT